MGTSQQSTSTGSASRSRDKANTATDDASTADRLRITDTKYRNTFIEACKQSWTFISNDELFLLPQAKHG